MILMCERNQCLGACVLYEGQTGSIVMGPPLNIKPMLDGETMLHRKLCIAQGTTPLRRSHFCVIVLVRGSHGDQLEFRIIS